MADQISFPLVHPLYGWRGGIHASPSVQLSQLGVNVHLPDGSVAPLGSPDVMRHYANPQQAEAGSGVQMSIDSGDPVYDRDALFLAKRGAQHGGLPGPPQPIPAAMVPKIAGALRQALRGDGTVRGRPFFHPNDTLEPGEEEAGGGMQPMARKQSDHWFEDDTYENKDGGTEGEGKDAWYEEDDPEMDLAGHHAKTKVAHPGCTGEGCKFCANKGNIGGDGEESEENESEPESDDPWKESSKKTALGEAQLDGGVGGQVKQPWDPNINGPNPEGPNVQDVGNASHEQEVAIETWVNMAVDMLNQGLTHDVIVAELSAKGCPPQMVEPAIDKASRLQAGPDAEAGEDAFAGTPMSPGQEPPADQTNNVSMPMQNISSDHAALIEFTEKHAALQERKVAADLWGENMSEQEAMEPSANPMDEIQDFINSFEPVDEMKESSVRARIENLSEVRRALRKVDVQRLSATEQILFDNIDVDAQLGILNLSSRLTDFAEAGLHVPYRYNAFKVGNTCSTCNGSGQAQTGDGEEIADCPDCGGDGVDGGGAKKEASEEATEIMVSELSPTTLADEESVREAARFRGFDPDVAVRIAKEYQTLFTPTQKTAAYDPEGPAEGLYL